MTHGILWPSASKSAQYYPLIFLSRSLCWGGRKHRVKEEHCIPWTTQFGRGIRELLSSVALIRKEGSDNHKNAEVVLLSRASSPLLANFKFLLQRLKLGGGNAIERGVQVVLQG